MSAATGFHYFYSDVLGLNVNAVKASYNFNIQSGNQLVNDGWATQGSNGTIHNSGNFYSNSGSGAFNGANYVSINSGFNLPSWTIFLSYERVRSGVDEVLFSTMTGSNFANSSGILVGINTSNHLYFEYWNSVDGPQVYTFSEIIGDKNMVSFSKSDASIFFNYYDANSKLSIIQQNLVYKNNLIDNFTTFYLGGRPSGNFLIPTNNFSGYIDNFVLISGNMDAININTCFSGFYSQKAPPIQNLTIVCSSLIYASGSGTPFNFSGQDGFQTFAVSNSVDICGIVNTIYSFSGLSGVVSGNTFLPISGFGSECVTYTGYSDGGLDIKTGYLFSFGMNQVSLFWNIDSGDIADAFVITGMEKNITRNKIANYNALNNVYFTDQDYTTNSLQVFLNGQSVIESGYLTYQDGYDTKYILTGDYFLDSTFINSTGRFLESDVILYDIVNQQLNSVFFTGHQSGAFTQISSFANSEVFLNGQKLISGNDWSLPNILNYQIDSGNNVLSILPITGFSAYQSGNTGTLFFPYKFLRGTSEVYFNGVRSQLGNSAVENSNLDLLSGNFIQPKLDNLYNNTSDFLNM